MLVFEFVSLQFLVKLMLLQDSHNESFKPTEMYYRTPSATRFRVYHARLLWDRSSSSFPIKVAFQPCMSYKARVDGRRSNCCDVDRLPFRFRALACRALPPSVSMWFQILPTSQKSHRLTHRLICDMYMCARRWPTSLSLYHDFAVSSKYWNISCRTVR